MTLAPDPDTLVTYLTIRQHDPNLTRHTLQKWHSRGMLKPIIRKGPRGHQQFHFRLGDVQALQARYVTPQALHPPPGHMHLNEAGIRLSCCEANIRRMLSRGTLKGAYLEYAPGSGRWFPAEAEVCRIQWESTPCPFDEPKLAIYEPGDNPLISADHWLCLQARREQFEKRLAEGKQPA